MNVPLIEPGPFSPLRHFGLLPPDPRIGSLAAPAHPHVLLETVAQGAHEDQESVGAADEQMARNQDRAEQQELLAPVADAGHAERNDERLAEKPGLDLRA